MNAIQRSEAIVQKIDERDDISENRLQNEVCKRLRPLETALGFVVVHNANGGKRRPREGRQLKNRGVRAGFPDLAIYYRGGVALIELKVPNGSVSKEQEALFTTLDDLLHPVSVCTSVASVLCVLRQHGLRV